jgi:hypothetical protein
MIPRVFIASPYAGSIHVNTAYARTCMADSLRRGEAPYAPHLLYTQPFVLNDNVPEEREKGMAAGMRFLIVCDKLAVYVDRGISSGMKREIDTGLRLGTPIEFRKLSRQPVDLTTLDLGELRTRVLAVG